MDISGILKTVVLNLKAKDHETVLNEMARGLLPPSKTDAGRKALCDLKSHESMEGALSGTGAAIFHCISEDAAEPVLAIAVTRKDLQHPTKKGSVRVFFLLISPIKDSGTHLQLLSKLEGMVHDRALRHAIVNAQSLEDVKKALARTEAASRSVYVPLSREEVFSELETSGKGLDEAEASRRLKLVGENSLKKITGSTLLKDFLYNLFVNLFAVLLWAGGIMAFVAGMPELGWAIFLVIIINAAFSFWQEFKAEKAVEALSRLMPKKVRVVRAGAEKEIEASALVPGDLVKLAEGDSVPADGRLITAEAMRVDNSPLTGESKPIYKISEPLSDGKGFIWTEMPNLVFAGTGVVSGDGEMIVTATGMDTEIGRVAYLTQAIKAETSPLQKELAHITRIVTFIACALGLLFFVLGYTLAGLTFAESFIFAIGIIVANVPEGLLPTVSLSLAMGVQRMAGKNAIVKKLSAVETLGSATVICTDKTGTLTSNRMTVVNLYMNGLMVDVTGQGYAPAGEFLTDGKAAPDSLMKEIQAMLAGAALCNNAVLKAPEGKSNIWSISGDPTEGALLTAAAKAGIDLEKLKQDLPRTNHLPFERIRKRMTTVHGASNQKQWIAFVKGSPREVLELSTRIRIDGHIVELDDALKQDILQKNDELASRGLRILAVAERTVKPEKEYKAKDVENELTFLGLAAMLDAPRPEVKNAIAECKAAGIRVVMITGDYGLTAHAIASQVGMGEAPRIITGAELASISHVQLKEILRKGDVIFARVAPDDKLRVVTALQDNGEVVAVTGDGVNDAPALKKADIGVAMGLRGSEVAKESAEIVLADDNFASIVDAVREGRAVYANIKKFVTYIFASNIPEIVPFIAFVIFKIPLPLTVMQILAVDLGTDVLPALALGVDPPEKGVMKQPPRPRGQKLLDFKTLSRAYLFLGPMEAVLCMAGFFFAYWVRGWVPGMELEATGLTYAAATTMTFAGIVASQIGNVFACRTEKESVFGTGLLSNKFILYAIGAEALLTAALINIPVLRDVFGFSALTLKDIAFLAAFPLVMVLVSELRKAVLRKNR